MPTDEDLAAPEPIDASAPALAGKAYQTILFETRGATAYITPQSTQRDERIEPDGGRRTASGVRGSPGKPADPRRHPDRRGRTGVHRRGRHRGTSYGHAGRGGAAGARRPGAAGPRRNPRQARRGRRQRTGPGAAAARPRWPAPSGSPPPGPRSASRRSSSASFPASGARSAYRGWWARVSPFSSFSPAASSRPKRRAASGFVNEVVPPDGLLPRAEAILAEIYANAPLAAGFALKAVNAGLDGPPPCRPGPGVQPVRPMRRDRGQARRRRGVPRETSTTLHRPLRTLQAPPPLLPPAPPDGASKPEARLS